MPSFGKNRKLMKFIHQAAFLYYDPNHQQEYLDNYRRIITSYSLSKIKEAAHQESIKLENFLNKIPQTELDRPANQRFILALHWLDQISNISSHDEIPFLDHQHTNINNHIQDTKKKFFRRHHSYLRI